MTSQLHNGEDDEDYEVLRGEEDDGDWHYLKREECLDFPSGSPMSEASEGDIEERGQGDCKVSDGSHVVTDTNEQTNFDTSHERTRNHVSFCEDDDICPDNTGIGLDAGGDSSDFVTLDPSADRTTDSCPEILLNDAPSSRLSDDDQVPPQSTNTTLVGGVSVPGQNSSELNEDALDSPSGCHDIYVGPPPVDRPRHRFHPRENLEKPETIEECSEGGEEVNPMGVDKDEPVEGMKEDGYLTDSSVASHRNPEAADQLDTEGNQVNESVTTNDQELVSFLTGPKFFIILIIAMVSLGLGHMIGQGKLQLARDEQMDMNSEKELQQLQKIQNMLTEQMSSLNAELQQERKMWQHELKLANDLLFEMKYKIEHGKSPHINDEVLDESIESDSGETVADSQSESIDLSEKLKELTDKYSLSDSDRVVLQKLLESKAKSENAQDSESAQKQGIPDIVNLVTGSLTNTKAVLQDYLKSFHSSMKTMNLTSAGGVLNATKENIVNVTEVLRVSELVGNTVFEVLSDKMSKVAALKENLTLNEVENFTNTHAQATVHKLNNLVSKTVEKLSNVKDSIASSADLKKLRKETDKTLNRVVKGVVNQWNSLASMVMGRIRKDHSSTSQEETSESVNQEENEPYPTEFFDDEVSRMAEKRQKHNAEFAPESDEIRSSKQFKKHDEMNLKDGEKGTRAYSYGAKSEQKYHKREKSNEYEKPENRKGGQEKKKSKKNKW